MVLSLQRAAGNEATTTLSRPARTLQREVSGRQIPTIAAEDLPWPNLWIEEGSKDNASVLRLQKQLNLKGASPPLALDGIFGPLTRQAVVAFQRKVYGDDQKANGVVDGDTWTSLFEISPKQTPVTKETEGTATKNAESTSTAATTHEGSQTRSPETVKTSRWMEHDWSNKDYTGEKKGKQTNLKKAELYKLLGQVAPHLSHELKVYMVGHAWREQSGSGVYNWNFAGIEGEWSKAYTTDVGTSATVSISKYENAPDKSIYHDWGTGSPYATYVPDPVYATHLVDPVSPGGVRLPTASHWSGTIPYQLALTPKPSVLGVKVFKRRPAFGSDTEGAAAFVHEIERRVQALQDSKDPDNNRLAEKVLAGDPHSYAYMVGHTIFADKNRKQLLVGAYNDAPSYTGDVESQIAKAKADLADIEHAR
jgi:hypothetical protein